MVTVEASERNWRRLKRRKDRGETMDDVLTDALDALEEKEQTHDP